MSKRDFEKYNSRKKVWKYDSNNQYRAKPGIKPNFFRMKAKYKGICDTCLKDILINSAIKYFPEFKSAVHHNCKNIQ